MSGYSQGRDVEYAVIDDLKANGFACLRAASSKGVADVVGVRNGLVVLVNVKRTTMPGPADRAALLALTMGHPHLVALVALKPFRQELRFRELCGVGPYEWRPWSPVSVAEVTR